MKLIKSWVEVENKYNYDELVFYYLHEGELGERLLTITSPLRTDESSLHKESERMNYGNMLNRNDVVVSERTYLEFEQHDKFFETYSLDSLSVEITKLRDQLWELDIDKLDKLKEVKRLEEIWKKF